MTSVVWYTGGLGHFFFFFQAEDGIRDWSVTGVQTCALPIYGEAGFSIDFNRNGGIRKIGFDASLVIAAPGFKVDVPIMRKVTEQITKIEQADRKSVV